jgi:spermidine synthase
VKPLRTIDSVETRDGTLALKQRGERDFLITCDGRVLMTSVARRSEEALGQMACSRLASAKAPRVLVGGLGMAYTLRAALDVLPSSARVTVAELNAITEVWCRGPLAPLTDSAVTDARVRVEIGDVTDAIARAAAGPPKGRFDAIVIDLYVGPDARSRDDHPLYGKKALGQAASALNPGGIFGIWGERYHAGFETRLERAGFDVRHELPGRGGLLHVIYLGTRRGR